MTNGKYICFVIKGLMTNQGSCSDEVNDTFKFI